MAIPIKAKYIQLTPMPEADAPNDSVFVDSDNNNVLTNKGHTGNPTSLIQETANVLFKQMQAGENITKGWPLAKTASGKVIRFDANDVARKMFCAYALANALLDAPVNTLLVGANLSEALTGLGFTSGDEIYLDTFGGYTNDPASIQADATADIIKVGVADCAGGAVASSTATDLITFPEVITRA